MARLMLNRDDITTRQVRRVIFQNVGGCHVGTRSHISLDHGTDPGIVGRRRLDPDGADPRVRAGSGREVSDRDELAGKQIDPATLQAVVTSPAFIPAAVALLGVGGVAAGYMLGKRSATA